MSGSDRTRRIERGIASSVALGVAATGVYDWLQGEPPSGVVDVADGVGLGVFLVGCVVSAVMVTVMTGRGHKGQRSTMLAALVVSSVVPSLVGDPTYASLLVAIPLIEARRRDDEPIRTIGAAGMVVLVAALLLGENTRRATEDVEVLLALALVFLVVVLLGDSLRQLDAAIASEARLAKVAERSRVAEELHDSLGHHLLAASVQLEKAQALQRSDSASSSIAVGHASQAVRQAIAETRLIVDATREHEHFELEMSIRELARRVLPSGTACSVAVDGDHENLGSELQVAILRVIQESFTNLVRHAEATMVSVSSQATAPSITLRVVDDGCGFDPETVTEVGGVANMRRRVTALGGTFTIDSGADGTAVTAVFAR